jgi:hypothetical protein
LLRQQQRNEIMQTSFRFVNCFFRFDHFFDQINSRSAHTAYVAPARSLQPLADPAQPSSNFGQTHCPRAFAPFSPLRSQQERAQF